AMRRVVADQITALAALSDVVKRQAGGFDISGPGLHAPPARETGSGKSEGAASPAPLTGTFGAQENKMKERSTAALRVTPLPLAKIAPAPRPAVRPGGDMSTQVPHFAPPAAAMPKPATAKAPVQRDLSRETESLMQKLNGAARDLVEAIDATLPPDLEQRYAG